MMSHLSPSPHELTNQRTMSFSLSQRDELFVGTLYCHNNQTTIKGLVIHSSIVEVLKYPRAAHNSIALFRHLWKGTEMQEAGAHGQAWVTFVWEIWNAF